MVVWFDSVCLQRTTNVLRPPLIDSSHLECLDVEQDISQLVLRGHIRFLDASELCTMNTQATAQ